MDNSTTTLQGEILLLNQFELVGPTTVAGTLYGIAFALFCLYVHSLAPRLQDVDRKIQARFMLAHSTVVMLCGLYSLVANAWVAQDAYIKHNNTPGGPYFHELTTFHTPIIIIAFTCQLAVDTLTTAIQIWRVWVIWNASTYARVVIVVPSLCFLTWTALRLRTLILEATLPIAMLQQQDPRTDIAQNAIQGATTILCTLLISLFLAFEQWRQRKLMGTTQGSVGYLKIIAMLIESYALESIWLLVVAVVFHPVVALFTETTTYIEIIAYLLVQYRVASGKAYESQRGLNGISSLHWNHSTHATTEFGTNETGGDSHVSVDPEAPPVLLVSVKG